MKKTLIAQAQKLAIVQPEVLTGRHHAAPGRVRAADLVKREAASLKQRKAAKARA
jgi:hypothetical protein